MLPVGVGVQGVVLPVGFVGVGVQGVVLPVGFVVLGVVSLVGIHEVVVSKVPDLAVVTGAAADVLWKLLLDCCVSVVM